MSQFPCLAAVSPENIDASIASCQSVAHWLCQVCWQTQSWHHTGNYSSVPLSSHSLYFLGMTRGKICQITFPELCHGVVPQTIVLAQLWGQWKQESGEAELVAQTLYLLSWSVDIWYFSVKMAWSGQNFILCTNSKILLVCSHSRLPGLLLAAFWHKVWL